MLSPNYPRLLSDIRTRVFLGDSREAIRDFHLKKGTAPEDIDSAIAEALRERRTYLRHEGIWDLFFGFACAVGFLTVAWLWRAQEGAHAFQFGAKVAALILIAQVAFPIGFLFFLGRGLLRLFRNGRERRSAADAG